MILKDLHIAARNPRRQNGSYDVQVQNELLDTHPDTVKEKTVSHERL